ncbi:MAG: LCP family protein [Dehalococcoidia bacterium]|nr:LCP family protein [Dehalococcoidia bacterium]
MILLSVFFFGSFLLARIGEALMNVAEPLAALPIVGGGGETAAIWKDKERVNILLLGTDHRQDEKGPSRTDTMLVFTIDPVSKSAGMLGIPRDMWVRISLEGGRWVEGKINTAHFYGEVNKYPGGGPALAKKTVESVLGIKIHYVARVDFAPFEKMVDALGGIDVDVEKPLKDDEYPTSDYGVKRIFIPAGLQHFNGEEALEYARSRHQDSDFGRMKRQQQVLVAMRDRAVGLGMLPKLPQLITQFKDMIYTDLAPAEALALAKLISGVDATNVTTRFIDTCCITPIVTVDGEEALMPNQNALKKVVGEVFNQDKTPLEANNKP